MSLVKLKKIFLFFIRNSIVHNGIKLLEYNRLINSQLHEEEKKQSSTSTPPPPPLDSTITPTTTTTTTSSSTKELMTLNEFLKEFQINTQLNR